VAARISPAIVPEVVSVLERLGGQVIAERDEWPSQQIT